MYIHAYVYARTCEHMREEEWQMKMDIYEWLRKFLQDGPKNVNDIRDAALLAGYSKREIREGKKLCRIKSVHNKADEWIWSLQEE